MGSTTFSITPAGGTQVNDAENMINDDNLQTSITFPVDILITDVVTTTTLTSAKQFSYQVMGIKATGNFYTPIIDPATDGRITWRDMNLVIPKGNSFAVAQAEQGAVAEFWRILIKYEPVR